MEIVSYEATSSTREKELSNENGDALTDTNNNVDSWPIRDQLMLISFAIVNGDSNWSYVCDQMNKFGLKKKTSAQCSKKYRQIINDFLNKTEKSEQKNQLIDLRKIYKEIADQRLEELNSSIKSLKDNYDQLVAKINELIYLENNEPTNKPLSSNLKYLIVRWLSLNIDIGEETFQDRYNQKLIEKIKLIEKEKELNEHIISLLEKDDDFKRHEDELLRQAQQEAELERLRLQQEEEEKIEREKKLHQEQIQLEKQHQDNDQPNDLEQEEKMDEELDEEVKNEQEEVNKIEVKIESQVDDENSKDSSKFSSEDDMPLLNIVKSKGLLIETTQTKSPSPLPSEKVRRSLRKGVTKTEEASSPNHMSSGSSTVSTISHKSVSLPCSSLSEQDKEHKNEVKASPSNTSSVYDNLDADDNHDVYKTKKKGQKQQNEPTTNLSVSGNLVSIKQEPKEGQHEINETNKAANISGSSFSSVSSSKTSEDEKSHRAWKKSIMMILNNIACHKHATIFMHPVKDEIAPGYSALIHRPIDLTTIKKNIETGITRTTKEFQRDIMLMFTNALMYNSTNHNIHRIALEMFKEVLADIEQLLNAQETLCSSENLDSSVYSINKSLRYKEMRSSSTASDGKSSILSNQNTSHDTPHDESVAGLLSNKKTHLTRDAKNNSKSSLKDESVANDTASIKSNSSVSTPRQSSTRAKNSGLAKLSHQKSPKTLAKKEETSVNSKKRKQSVSSGTTSLNATLSPSNNDQSKDKEEDAPKSKRRKSGR